MSDGETRIVDYRPDLAATWASLNTAWLIETKD